MALNFPNSPTNGQIYTDSASGNRWVWDSGNTCWVSTSTFTQTITVASTAPGSPVTGQLWWNKDYGRLLVYYTDDNTSQWVDASPSDYTGQLAYGVANAAFAKANTALQNTSGTFAGNLGVTGNGDFGLGTSHLKIPVGTTAQRPTGENGMIRMNTTTGTPEWYDTTNSTWQPFSFSSTAYDVDYLVVAGGGGGASGWINGNGTSGGGAGGYRASVTKVISGSSYTVTVGNGGTGAQVTASIGADGGNSSFGSITSIGGGGGVLGSTPARSGGSGGGSGNDLVSGGLGTSGQGFNGGVGDSTVKYRGGGGGGASAVGATGNASGNGGAGLTWLNGTTYAGGGGGGIYRGDIGGSGGSGGSGGGGAGGTSTSTTATAGTNATTNTGGGGGGGGSASTSAWGVGGNGASGIVIVRYSGQPRGTGGSITQSSGYTYHTFTSSGTFTA